MKRPLRLMFAFLWLTFGYWIVGPVLHLVVALLPFAQGGSGISVSSEERFHKVQFSGSPGDAVLVVVKQTGDNTVKFPAHITGSSSDISSVNLYAELTVAVLFAVISIPVLSRLLRSDANKQ
jgi:hypothetical protein